MDNEVKNRIRELRNKKGMSGAELALKLNISVQYLYDMERGKRTLSAENASKLSDIFQVTTDYLLGKTDTNLYAWLPDEQTEQHEKTPSQHAAEKEFLSDDEIDIEVLLNSKLKYKGRVLTEEEKERYIKMTRLLLE